MVGLSVTDYDREVGANIRRARKAQGIQQKELAAAVGYAAQQLCRVETGKISIGIRWLLPLATALGLRASALLPPHRPGVGR